MYPYSGILILGFAMDWMFVFPPSLNVEALISNVRKLGGGLFDKEIGLGEVIRLESHVGVGVGALLSKVKRH